MKWQARALGNEAGGISSHPPLLCLVTRAAQETPPKRNTVFLTLNKSRGHAVRFFFIYVYTHKVATKGVPV